ncbi:MAG TPA: hypothetical protein VLA43_13855 [Longimicrobiales bacterium]|nr:hypothetical protein [Longimicrobiales bacterium]
MVVLVAAALPLDVSAQAVGDTVRYRETTDSRVVVETPGEVVTFESTHDALVAVHFATADSMGAWYEALAVTSRGPDGETVPATSTFLGEGFSLRYGADGRVETLATPAFTDEVAGITDLRFQFEDFFPHRIELPLELGVAWADTAVTLVAEEGRETRMERVSRYRVVSDTVVGGEPHLVVEATARINMEGSGPMAGEPRVTVSTSMDGVEENVFVMRRWDGRMWSRTRSGELTGSMAYLGMREPVEFPMRRNYVNRITTVR